jgi:hypothetical protein
MIEYLAEFDSASIANYNIFVEQFQVAAWAFIHERATIDIDQD